MLLTETPTRVRSARRRSATSRGMLTFVGLQGYGGTLGQGEPSAVEPPDWALQPIPEVIEVGPQIAKGLRASG